jgi:hypothetical protein
MTTSNQKHQILASLESMDHAQAEKVLNYIKGILDTPRESANYQKLKVQALREIGQALGRNLNPVF